MQERLRYAKVNESGITGSDTVGSSSVQGSVGNWQMMSLNQRNSGSGMPSKLNQRMSNGRGSNDQGSQSRKNADISNIHRGVKTRSIYSKISSEFGATRQHELAQTKVLKSQKL